MTGTKTFALACAASLAVGLSLVATPSLGGWPWEDSKVEVHERAEVREAPGRYQIVSTGGGTYLLDTIEGRVWQRIRYTDLKGTPAVWASMDVLRPGDKFVSLLDVIRSHGYDNEKQAP